MNGVNSPVQLGQSGSTQPIDTLSDYDQYQTKPPKLNNQGYCSNQVAAGIA